MPFVVDASVVGSWVLPDENHPLVTFDAALGKAAWAEKR
jgi:hypothetical protein